MPTPERQPTPLDALLAETDHCVKCGLCLPRCPTYRLHRDEAESPRGRIALIEGLAKGQLAVDQHLDRHLDSCLLCLRCEAACPSGVHFGHIMDQARSMTLSRRPDWLCMLIDRLAKGRIPSMALSLGRQIPLQLVPKPFRPLVELTRTLKRNKQPIPAHPEQVPDESAPEVALFTGCSGELFWQDAAAAAGHLLTHCGYRVHRPEKAQCCGALHTHLGDDAQAARANAAITQAFAPDRFQAVINLASGCHVHLQHNSPQPRLHQEICHFLATQCDLGQLRCQPLTARVALHTPCTQKEPQQAKALLNLIPGIELVDLSTGYGCCGGAGSHFLSHPETAAQLRAPLLTAIENDRFDYLVTTNPGCAMHIAVGLGDNRLPVIHPVVLLAQQLVAP